MAVASDRGEEILWLLVADRPLAEPASMCAWPDAGIIAVAPVCEVVAALLAWPGVIGDFIGGQSGRSRQFLCQLEHVRRRIRVQRLELVPGDHGSEARARLDGQLVEGQMAGAETECAPEHRLPFLDPLTGKGVDQVEADAFEVALRRVEGCKALARAVGTAEEGEGAVVEALEAKARSEEHTSELQSRLHLVC